MAFIEKTYKVVLIGPAESGKTKARASLFQDVNSWNYHPTLGIDIEPTILENDGHYYQFNIWDTAGDPRYLGLGEDYYEKADFFVVFSDDPAWLAKCGTTPRIIFKKDDQLQEILLRMGTRVESSR